MVSIKIARTCNSQLLAKRSPMVALFVGGTSGIGKGTLRQLAKYTPAPKIYIVGRSKSSASPLLSELQALNPKGTFIFRETEISLIKNVDVLCDEIKAKEQRMDLVFLSPGYLTLEGRNETPEGIDLPSSLIYYARLRIVHNLLPLLSAAPAARVISILGGGMEAPIDLHDLEVRTSDSFLKRMNAAVTQTTLAFEELAKSHPAVSFAHVYPGFVNTGQIGRFLQSVRGVWSLPATLANWTLVPLVSLFARTIDDAGEMGVFIATSAKYPPASSNPAAEAEGAVTALPPGVEVAKPTVVEEGRGNGVYRLDAGGESVQNKGDAVLAGYRADGVGKTVLEHAMAVWDRALGRA